MNEEKNFNKIAKYLSDNIDPKEREELFAWVEAQSDHKEQFEDSLEVWETAENAEDKIAVNTDEAWAKMNQRLNAARATSQPNPPIRRLSFVRPWMRIAAALILALSISWWLYIDNGNSSQLFDNPIVVSEKTTIELPDGSKVWLNENTKLTYEKLFDKRVVALEGEAFFEVAKMNGKPFEIFAGSSKTTVLGTSFNVRAYPKEKTIEVAVETGKVSFEDQENEAESTFLEAGEYAIYIKKEQKIQKATKQNLNAAAWKKVALQFNNTKIGTVAEALERYYNIEVVIPNEQVANCIWNNTQTYQNPDLDQILEVLKEVMSGAIEIERTNDKVYHITGNGCN